MSGQWQKRSFHAEILEQHIDSFGHVNHATYLQIMELARWEAITTHGMGMDYVIKNRVGPVVLDLHIRYKKELHIGQKIRIDTQVTEFDGRIGELKQEIYSEGPEGDSCHSTAEIKFGVFDLNTRKLLSPSMEWKKAVGWVPQS